MNPDTHNAIAIRTLQRRLADAEAEVARLRAVVDSGAAVIEAQQAHVKNVRIGSDTMIRSTAMRLAEAIKPYNQAVAALAPKPKEPSE